MVHDPKSTTSLTGSDVRPPRRSQPWELAMLLFGLPGAAVLAAASSAFAVVGSSMDPLIGIAGFGVALSLYFTTMAVLWVGTSAELG